ncbi:MAG TPA: DNA recombination protein RmuC [Patescibacteria group bacterium]|nr:DNA recombination protein RmuC [Patescibacteria group bacterium]
MQYELLIILIILVVAILLLYRKVSQISKSKSDELLLEWLKTMQKSLDSSTSTMNRTLHENSKQLIERLDKTALAMQSVGKEVGQMSEIGRSMKELQEFLKSPKLRGNIGEHVLKDLISQMFPKSNFFLQYEFKTGDRVDAAIKTDAGILPIDSKFPMENFQKMFKTDVKTERSAFQREFVRDIKKHISTISKKYILPSEGTMDFALMYVPSESVYYEIVNLPEIMDFARSERVYIVSPSTLYAHLQTILLSFEGRKIEEKSKEIFTMIRGLQTDYNKVNESLSVLGKHLGNASSQFSNVFSGFLEIGQKINITKRLEEKITKQDKKN